MKCKIPNSTLIKFLNNELPELEMKSIKKQINNSKPCSKLLFELQSTYNIINKIPKLETNPYLYYNVIDKITTKSENKTKINLQNSTLFRTLQPTLITASFILALITGIKIGGIYTKQPNFEITASYDSEFYMNDLQLESIENYLWEN